MAPRARVHRVGTLNAKNDGPAVARFLGRGCHSVTLNEVNHVGRVIARASGYRTFYSAAGLGDRRRLENQALIRRSFEVLGAMDLRASEQVRPVRIAPDRYLRVQMFAGPLGPTGHVAWHPNYVGGADNRPRTPRIRENDEASGTLDAVLTLLEAEGFHIVAGGDANTFDGRPSPGWDDLFDVLHAHDMRIRSSGLDVVAWSPSLALYQQPEVIPRRHLGRRVDHDALIVTLTHA